MVVREDSLTLFGFVDEDEKQIFELVQTASGVGPKVAQAITAVLSPDDLRRAIATDDVKTLTRVPGHRPEGRPADHPGAQGPDRSARRRVRRRPRAAATTWRDQVHQGLVGLGWPPREAERAVDAVADRPATPPTCPPCCAPPSRPLSKA